MVCLLSMISSRRGHTESVTLLQYSGLRFDWSAATYYVSSSPTVTPQTGLSLCTISIRFLCLIPKVMTVSDLRTLFLVPVAWELVQKGLPNVRTRTIGFLTVGIIPQLGFPCIWYFLVSGFKQCWRYQPILMGKSLNYSTEFSILRLGQNKMCNVDHVHQESSLRWYTSWLWWTLNY